MADRLPLIQILRAQPDAAAAAPAAARTQWPAVVERLRQHGAARARRSEGEACEFCGAAIAGPHGHLVDLTRRALVCVCRPCALLFAHDGAGGARFRAVPERYALVSELGAAREGWNALDIPIGLAFFLRSTETGRTTAFYPSPGGAIESELPLDTWDAFVRAAPLLSTLAPDVEALLVRRFDEGAPGSPGSGAANRAIDALIVPIDACYELVGLVRVAWRGVQGGDDLRRHIDAFFEAALERAQSAAP